MANYIDKLDDQDGNVIYPITLTKAVYKENTSSTLDDLLAAKLDTSAYTASDALAKIKTVDGTGSGLDADLLDGKEASAFSLNNHVHILSNVSDVTATAAEVNVLDGITANTSELNYTDGVTSNIQMQLNSKQSTLSFDTTPVSGSNNPVTSDGIYDALALKSPLVSPNFTGVVTASGDLFVAGGVSFLGGRYIQRNFSGRQKTFLLFEFDKSYSGFTNSESFDFDIYDARDYDLYGAINVLIDRTGNGLVKSWGFNNGSFYVRVKTYDDTSSGKIRVYAVTDNYVDYFTLNLKYNRDFNALLGTQVGDNTYVPSGVLIFDSTSAGAIWYEGTPSNSRTLTLSNGNIISSGAVTGTQLISNIASGTPPLVVTSPTVVSNLNADKLDGNDASAFALASHNHTVTNIDGLQTALDNKVDDSQVLTNVPANAVFTDTVYIHPASHPPSIITQDSSNRFVTDAEKSTWNAKEPAITKNTAFNVNFDTIAADIKMNGTPSVGSLSTVARADHVHPTDTSRAASSHTHTESDITNLTTDLATKAPLASPSFTGIPTAPTATSGNNTAQLATTAFVQDAVASSSGGTTIIVSSTQPTSQAVNDLWFQVIS